MQTYPSSPLGQLSAGGTYYDVTIAPCNTFTQVVFTVCGVPAGHFVQWRNPLAQVNQRMSLQTGITGKASCVTATVTASTSPTLTQLVGTGITVPSPRGYTMAGADGAVFPFGDAGFFGSEAGTHLNKPIVGMAMTPDRQGYWLVASDGGIFTFGGARFFGSEGATPLNQPVVGMAATPDGQGYWMVASDGGVFTLGDARFFGSQGATRLNKPAMLSSSARNNIARHANRHPRVLIRSCVRHSLGPAIQESGAVP